MEEAKEKRIGFKRWIALGGAIVGSLYGGWKALPEKGEAERHLASEPSAYGYLDTRITRLKEYVDRNDGDRRAQIAEVKTDLKSELYRLSVAIDKLSDRLDRYNDGMDELLRRIPKKREVSSLFPGVKEFKD